MTRAAFSGKVCVLRGGGLHGVSRWCVFWVGVIQGCIPTWASRGVSGELRSSLWLQKAQWVLTHCQQNQLPGCWPRSTRDTTKVTEALHVPFPRCIWVGTDVSPLYFLGRNPVDLKSKFSVMCGSEGSRASDWQCFLNCGLCFVKHRKIEGKPSPTPLHWKRNIVRWCTSSWCLLFICITWGSDDRHIVYGDLNSPFTVEYDVFTMENWGFLV